MNLLFCLLPKESKAGIRAEDFPPSLDLSSYEVVITDVDKKWTKNFIATLHANNPPGKGPSVGRWYASNLSIFAALTVNFKNYRGAFPRSVIGVARDYNFDGIDSDWEFPTSPQNMSNLSHLLEELQISLEKEHIASGRQKLLPMAAVYFSTEFFLSK
ncbi:class V chitinase CHIT5a-like [Eucalyptus grandis]|uniref:class V chitinase CHIT5a-like n=1 Tax=Eucalyptus grandis TaxID=71139 RepID=UPI00192EEF84|nr:class V chitinase CHIT5a-like [Eucalyptus grandis]